MKWMIINTNKVSEDYVLYWNEKKAEWDGIENATIYNTKALNTKMVKDGSFVSAPEYIVRAQNKEQSNVSKKT